MGDCSGLCGLCGWPSVYVFVMDPQEFMDSVCILWARSAMMTRGIFPWKFNGKLQRKIFFLQNWACVSLGSRVHLYRLPKKRNKSGKLFACMCVCLCICVLIRGVRVRVRVCVSIYCVSIYRVIIYVHREKKYMILFLRRI